MLKRAHRSWLPFLAALGLLALSACSRKGPMIAPSPLAQSFDPLRVIASVVEREGLSASTRMGGGSCGNSTVRSAGGPTIVTAQCRIPVEFSSREDAARLTRAVFADLEQAARAHAEPGGVGTAGSAEDGEMHLYYCSREPRNGETGSRGCLFLHFYAVERNDGPQRISISYYFTLDEERTLIDPEKDRRAMQEADPSEPAGGRLDANVVSEKLKELFLRVEKVRTHCPADPEDLAPTWNAWPRS